MAAQVESCCCRHCTKTKTMMLRSPELLHALLGHLADALAVYVCHQIDAGAQVIAACIHRPAMFCLVGARGMQMAVEHFNIAPSAML